MRFLVGVLKQNNDILSPHAYIISLLLQMQWIWLKKS